MDLLPQFPLQLVLYPGEELNLHIFEPRYRQLILEAEENGSTFGIPAFIDNRVMGIGTEAELLGIEETYAGGEMDVRTRGVGLYTIEEFFDPAPDRLYAAARVKSVETEDETDIVLGARVLELTEQLYRLLKVDHPVPADVSELYTYDIAHHVGLNLQQEYELLSIADEYGRLEFILEHLEHVLPVVEKTEQLKKKALMNGHFKNILPPDFSK